MFHKKLLLQSWSKTDHPHQPPGYTIVNIGASLAVQDARVLAANRPMTIRTSECADIDEVFEASKKGLGHPINGFYHFSQQSG